MRTLIIIIIGVVTYSIIIRISKFFKDGNLTSDNPITIIFIVCWLLFSSVNMWIGISKAHYSFMEELPIFLLIFLVPSAKALVIQWKFLR